MKETIKYFSAQEKELPINVSMTGISICDKDSHYIRNYYVRNKPNVTIIEYVFKGEGTLLINNKKIDVKTDDIYILPAGMVHEYYANSQNPWAKYFMNLSGSLAHSLLVDFSINNHFVFSAPSLKPFFKKIMQISFSDLPETEKQPKIISLYFEILYRLSVLNKDAEKNNEAVSMKKFLDENRDRLVTNSELANHIYRSPDYSLKLFKREFGTTPYDYQIKNKIHMATSLLQHTKKSVTEISELVGYQNPQYFTSLFKSKMGMTPTQYRKKFN